MSAYRTLRNPGEVLRMFRASVTSPIGQSRASSNSLFPFPRRTKRTMDPEFKPPPISARLRPLIPFFIIWTMITSLEVHRLRERITFAEQSTRQGAQLSVLERLVNRLSAGEEISEEERERELEMVGLRERNWTKEGEGMGEMREVGWREVFLGRKRKEGEDGQEEQRIEQEWRNVVTEATQTPAEAQAAAVAKARAAVTPASSAQRAGSARRAKSADDYLG